MSNAQPRQQDGAGQMPQAPQASSGAGAEVPAEMPQDMPPFDMSVTPDDEEGPVKRLGGVIKQPSIGASITGVAVLGAAAAFGWLEAAVAAGAAYGAYRLLRKKAPEKE